MTQQAILLLLCFKFDIENNYIFIFSNSNQPTIFFASNRVDCTDLNQIWSSRSDFQFCILERLEKACGHCKEITKILNNSQQPK